MSWRGGSMNNILKHAITAVIAAIIGFSVANYKANLALYQNDLQGNLVNIDIVLRSLIKIRENDHAKAVSFLELSMLMDVSELEWDGKVVGWNSDMQQAVNKVNSYCINYNVFEGKSNWPSHYVAKRFLESHATNK